MAELVFDPTIIDKRAAWLAYAPGPTGCRWKLRRVIYQDELQSGGRHNIECRLFDKQNKPVGNVAVTLGFPDYYSPAEETVQSTGQNGANDPGMTDFPMYGGPFYPDRGEKGPYYVYVGEKGRDSDALLYMGLPANRHVQYLAEWQEAGAEPPPPNPDPDPEPSPDLAALTARVEKLEQAFDAAFRVMEGK